MNPAPDPDGHRWQMLAARVLVDLETAAGKTDLPVLDWTISGARLLGRPLPSRPADEILTAWQAWTHHLDAEPVDEQTTSLGTRILRSFARASPGPGHIDVRVMLIAEIPADQ